jgi:molybdopterin-guanine dinucleotide biosynthesis protein B
MKIFGFAGWSGSGKTTLVTKLIPELVGRGVRVSTMKHAHHAFDIDQPGKDSYEHRAAGATEVMVGSASRWALIHEIRDDDEPSIDELAGRMAPVDLLLVEGFKAYPHDKMEVYRAEVGKPLLCLTEEHIVAVASDAPVPEASVPVLDLNDVAAIADFILKRTGLKPARGAA